MPDTAKFNLRMPAELHQQATELAARLGISLNAFAVLALRNWVEYQDGKLGKGRLPARQEAQPSAPLRPPSVSAAPVRVVPKVGKHQRCPCGSGQLYGQCHGRRA